MSLAPEQAPDSGTFQVALSFEDGVTRFITCRPDQTVADASYRQRINIPLDCRDGACGTCKAMCESGEFDPGTYIDDALTEAEAQDGYVLPCSMRPRSDLVLQIASTSAVAKTQAATYTGTVVGLDRLSDTTVELAIEIPNRDELAFLPGQYVNIKVPGTDETRSYSFSNAPDAVRLTFLVKLTPGGLMSDWLVERAQVGDEVSFTGPNGSFFLRETDRPVLLLAGGTGLAPILSMLRKLHADGSDRRAHLVYGASTDIDVVKLAELEELAAALPGLTWDHCVSDPNTSAANKGYVTTLIRDEHLNGGDVAIYLCGPPPMVESVRTHLVDGGVEPTGFYYEKFALANAPAAPAPAEPAPAEPAPAEPAAERPQAPVEPAAEMPEALVEAAAQPPVKTAVGMAGERAVPEDLDELLLSPDSRSVAGQELHPATALQPYAGTPGVPDTSDVVRRVAGQLMFEAGQGVDSQSGPAGIAAPPALPTAPAAAVHDAMVAEGGYLIGEEHPDVRESDALFEAREALELGALQLTIGRMSKTQLVGYRLLAEATLPYVDESAARFVDASAYTDSNAAFHDYLFAQTGNIHLLQAYQALGVKGRMEEVLQEATWCHPLCARDHVDIVNAFEAGDRARAQQLIQDHAERSKQTMRRAMSDRQTTTKPRFVSPGRFAGQVVVVTGAAQGIGEAVSRRISAEGGKLVLVDRSELVLELAGELSSGGEAVGVTADLETWEGAVALVDAAIRAHGRIDILINNVGGAINFKPFTEFDAGQIRAEIDRSLMTTLFACRAALPPMVQAGHGVIVNVSSAATRGVHRIPYSAAKGGINAITASLAMEYADQGIRVVATAPGGTEAPPRRISRGTPEPRNDVEKAWFQAHIDQTLDSSLMHRYGTLEEQAAAICFLASPEAGYITGTVLPVAGGDLG